MTAILGLNAQHADSAACLVVDGQLVAAVAEERLGPRIKHSPAFPELAIRAVMEIGGVRFKDLSHVVIGRDAKSNQSQKIKYVLTHPIQGGAAAFEHFRRRRASRGLLERVADACGEDPTSSRAQLVNLEHHLGHIASAYYCSPFEQLTAGLSYDGSGDFVSMMAARCEGTSIEVLDRVYLPHSLGFFYTAVCQLIGFDGFGEEYKVMGLAAYGEDRWAELMRSVMELPDNGWFRLRQGYFGMHQGGQSDQVDAQGRLVMGRFYGDAFARAIGHVRRRDEEIGQLQKDLAKSCQVRFEEAAMHCAKRLHAMVPTERIAYAGGCALNGVANARLLRDTPFKTPYLQCAASDDGICVGAALWVWHNLLGRKERFHMKHAYWGPEHSDRDMEAAARTCGTRVVELPRESVARVAAHLIRSGLVLGWYQGRSEWGPRALGNRSILADPTFPDTKDKINAKIKRREMFRPFAPTVLTPRMGEYFEQKVHSPFMMHVVKIRPEWQPKLPAVTHVDGTGRVQSIERETNALYYDLIDEFSKLSGVAIVLNTSFNENEPIVDTPQQAADCFKRTGLDGLMLGRWVTVKAEHVPALEKALEASGVAQGAA
ncbi:MAG: hypothetical protein KF724_09075 [Phycisphaeraceae bacterium]|nr:hypothetical protein [Phycisphaeraceae bacterium]